jgi:hypothetical protein
LVLKENEDSTNPERRKQLFLAICNNKNMIYQDFQFYMGLTDDEFSEYLSDPNRRSREKKELKENNTKKRKSSVSPPVDNNNDTKRTKDEHPAVDEVAEKKQVIQNVKSIIVDNAPIKDTSMQGPNDKTTTEELKPKARIANVNQDDTVEKEEQLQKIETKQYFVYDNVQPINRFKITFPNNTYINKLFEKNETLISYMKHMIYQRFDEFTNSKRAELRKKNRKKLLQNIDDVVNKYSCYFLVDSVNNGVYYAKDDIMCMNPGEKADHIVSCMILEKDVIVNENYCEKEAKQVIKNKRPVSVWTEKKRDKQACIIHFICTKSGLESQSYGRRLLKTVFSNEKDLQHKTVYGISKTQYMKKGKLSTTDCIL